MCWPWPAARDVLLVPERVSEGHGLAPVSHRERWIERPGLDERGFGRRVLEKVQQQHAAQELLLRGGGACGRREIDRAEACVFQAG